MGEMLSSIKSFAIAGVLYAASAISFSMLNDFILSYKPLNVLLSWRFPLFTVYPNIHPFLSHAVSIEYAKTCLCSPLWNQPLSGSVVLCFSSFGVPAPPSFPFPLLSSLLFSLSFNGFFPCSSLSSDISSFNCFS